MPWLINAAQLDKFRKNQKNVVILDANWYLPNEGRDPKAEFLNAHILGARFFDIQAFSDPNAFCANMLIRDENLIAQKLGEIGLTRDQKIIFYDNNKVHSSCRALWMLKVFGHNPQQLYILDGGYKAWEKYSGKTESGEPRTFITKSYQVNFAANLIRSLVQMKTNLHNPAEQVIDTRHPVRYAGGKETRSHLRSGHIPGSFSFPYFTMFEEDGTFKHLERIRKQLTGIGVELSLPIITTCGSGMSAATLNFVLDLLGNNTHSLYDGSWMEWGSDQLYPGETNLSERPIETSLGECCEKTKK